MINHLAIIMDGNGRWGKKHHNSRNMGHKKGAETLDRIVKHSYKIGIKTLSVYAFSTENWKRPKIEVNALMKLFYNYLDKEKEKLNDKNIRLIVSGSRKGISEKLIKKIEEVEKYLKDNEKFTLNICFNYGGRSEICDAYNKLIKKGLDNITEDDISKELYNNLEDPDLVIRTGGDFRISNFLIWQIAYSELYFSDILWPDFTEKNLDEAIANYTKRNRRFGGIDVK